MKRHICAAMLALTLAPCASLKADTSYSLLVNTLDGNTVEYDFEYLPVATFEGDVMIITDDRDVNGMRFEMENVVNMTIKTATSGVDGVETAGRIKVSVADGWLKVSGLAADARMTVYDAAGNAVASAVADPDGSASVNVSGLAKGVYVAAMPGCSFKFIR